MRLIIDVRMVTSSGIGRYTQQNLYQLAAYPYEIILITDNNSYDFIQNKYGIQNNIQIIKVPFSQFSLKNFFFFYRYLPTSDFIWIPHLTPFIPFKIGKNTKLIYTIHDLNSISLTFPRKIIFYMMAFFSCIFADKIIAISYFTKNMVSKKFLRIFDRKIFVIYNGVSNLDANQVNISSCITQHLKTPYFLIVGNVKPHKNINSVVNVFSAYNMEIKLLIAGKVDNFDKLNIPNSNIIYLGNVSDAELNCLYQNATLFIFPSLCEGFGLPLLEAMLHNKKIACSDIAIFREIAGDTVSYFNPYSEQDIKKAIFEALNNNPQYDDILVKFNWADSVKELHYLLTELYENKKPN